ncbi:MAG: MaoC family dehydratase [Gammaproteobacteria bacterium]
MLVLDTPQDFKAYVGKELGVSDWIVVDQQRIDRFAEATEDFQWIHIDVERAQRELPTRSTIAHGYLTLSLIPVLMDQISSVRQRSRRINYGLNKVRFPAMVPAGSRVRLRQVCKQVEDVAPNGVRVIMENTVELEGNERPACVAETIALVFA